MKGLKRTVRKFGKPVGHRAGIISSEILDYRTAREKIYIPSYNWILINKLQKELTHLISEHQKHDLVLLDYESNEDINDLHSPLSHASLIKKYILNYDQ